MPSEQALESVQNRILKAVGEIGVVNLAVLSAYRSGETHAFQINEDIKCKGDTYKGDIPYSHLLEHGLFTTKEGLANVMKNVEPSLDQIAVVFPYLPMMWVLEHKAQKRTRFVERVPGIDTSLPLELQYLQAAALPLCPRSRIAHVNFTIQILKTRNADHFQPRVYKELMSLRHIHAQVSDVVPMLQQLEQQLGEFNEDENAVQTWWGNYS